MRSFAASGPAFPQLDRLVSLDWTEWHALADRLSVDLAGAADRDRRIHHLYLPVLFFCAARARAATRRPVVIGIQAPQGAGKTTLVRHLIARMADLGLRAAGVSIDDFYLPRADQLRLAASYPGNPYLEHRGYPGTHDVALGAATLDALRGLGPGSRATVRVPVYDKTAHSGRGDRAPDAAWRDVTGPLDVVFVEGWMLGFAPVAESSLPEPDLVAPNRALAEYAQWDRRLDAFVTLRPIDPLFVMRWRVEAEAETASQGRPALDRAAIEDYVRRFLPAYHLYGQGPGPVPEAHFLVYLDGERRASPPPADLDARRDD